jgi:hypothetical protein
MRNTMRNWMLGTALIAGLLGTGVANAAPREYRGTVEQGLNRGYDRGFRGPVRGGYDHRGYGVVVGGPVGEGYIPPCPGDGYVWDGGVWVLRGYRGVDRGYGYGPVARYDRGYDRGFDRGHDRGFDRGYRGRR